MEENKVSYFTLLVKTKSYEELENYQAELERNPESGYTNLDGHIDDAESKNNYFIIYPTGNFKTLGGVFIHRNKEGNLVYPVLKSVIVQADAEYYENKGDAFIREFFKDVTKGITDIYGTRDVCISVVHVDEGVPHLHVCFFPYDSERGEVPVFEDELGDEMYERVGKKWKLELAENVEGRETLTNDEYLHQQQMFFYNIATQDAIDKLQNIRTETRKAEECLEACNEEIRKASIELRDKTQARDSITQELKEIRAELLQETDLHSFIETACAQPAPSKNKDESIRILQARNGLLQQQMGKMQEDAKEVFNRLQASEAKNKDTEVKLREAESKAKESEAKADIADKLRIMYPDIYIELANTSKPHTKGKRKDKGSKDNTKAQ